MALFLFRDNEGNHLRIKIDNPREHSLQLYHVIDVEHIHDDSLSLRTEPVWVQAINLGPCRRPNEFLTSLHPCGCLSKIPNSQIHKVKK